MSFTCSVFVLVCWRRAMMAQLSQRTTASPQTRLDDAKKSSFIPSRVTSDLRTSSGSGAQPEDSELQRAGRPPTRTTLSTVACSAPGAHKTRSPNTATEKLESCAPGAQQP